MAKMNKVILASQSPRRKELLSLLKIDFEAIPADIEEEINPDTGSNPLFHKENVLATKQLESSHAVSVSSLAEAEEQEASQPSDQMAFLSYLVRNNGLSLEEFKQQAAKKGKLYQAYLNELNEILYDVFDDQVLTIYQHQIIIEEDFMEEMREWIDG